MLSFPIFSFGGPSLFNRKYYSIHWFHFIVDCLIWLIGEIHRNILEGCNYHGSVCKSFIFCSHGLLIHNTIAACINSLKLLITPTRIYCVGDSAHYTTILSLN
jgi:hypothetical protein